MSYIEHKFVWSHPCNTYTLAAICEYCGLIAFHSNSEPKEKNKKECKQACPNSPINKKAPN